MLERLPALERSSAGIHTHQAARLQELVEFIQSQVFYFSFNGIAVVYDASVRVKTCGVVVMMLPLQH